MEQDKSTDYILCECPLENIRQFTDQLLTHYEPILVKAPGICLTMIRAEDSVEKQEFYLGEALTTDCEVEINGQIGYGICLGDEPDRAYCMAVVEAVLAQNDAPQSLIYQFLAQQATLIRQQEETEFSHIMRTKVDFKLMEQV
jgi:alpha-D-ribose 1-methylphosphonate 5-triphosphate synthase subunit PhnG